MGTTGEQQPCEPNVQAQARDGVGHESDIATAIHAAISDFIGDGGVSRDRREEQRKERNGNDQVLAARRPSPPRENLAAVQISSDFATVNDVRIKFHGGSSRSGGYADAGRAVLQ